MSRRFEDVYEQHVWDVYGFLAYRLQSRADAEDLTQVTFERALRAWPRFDPEIASARTWLLAIARNALIDHHRRDRRAGERSISAGEVGAGELPASPGPEESAFGPDPELAAALGRLSDREREVLALRFGGDLGGREIAALLEITLANVQQVSSRALRKLRAELLAQPPSGPSPDSPAAASASKKAPEQR